MKKDMLKIDEEEIQDEYFDNGELELYDEDYSNLPNQDDLNYCIRILYDDGTTTFEGSYTRSPEDLIHVLNDGGCNRMPEWNTLDDILTLVYEELDEWELNKEKVMKLQIYNIATDKVVHSKKFK